MRIVISILGSLMLLAGIYIMVMNWACVIVSIRNKRKGIDRHHSTVPLVSAMPAILAAAMLPRPWGVGALLIPVLDIANLNLLFTPFYLIAYFTRKRGSDRKDQN